MIRNIRAIYTSENKGPVIKYVYRVVEGKLGGGGYETNYLNLGGGFETKNEWNTMSMINKTTDFYNTIYTFKKSSVCS